MMIIFHVQYMNGLFASFYMYIFVCNIADIISRITSPLLLIAVAASLGACYILSVKNAERKVTVFAHEFSLAQQYGLVAVCSLPLFYLAGAGAALFWVLGKIMFRVTNVSSRQQRSA
jgi:anoctamin-1